MDFREYTVVREGKEMVIQGTIREPVHWDFTIRMCEDDLPGITKVALSRVTLSYLVRSVFRRKKDSHWSESREEHLESVKAAAAEMKKRASEAESAKVDSAKGEAAVEGEEVDRPKRAPRAPRRETQSAEAAGPGAIASTNGKEPASTNGSSASAGDRGRSNRVGTAGTRPASAARTTGGKTVSFARQAKTSAVVADAAAGQTDTTDATATATATATTGVGAGNGTGSGIADKADTSSTVTGITDAPRAEAIDAASTVAANTTEGNAS